MALSPEFLELHKRLAEIEESVDNVGADKAVANIDELLAPEENPERQGLALWIRARIISEHQGLLVAVSDYQRAAELARDDFAVGIRYELGVGWRRAGEAGEAESVLRRTVDDATAR